MDKQTTDDSRPCAKGLGDGNESPRSPQRLRAEQSVEAWWTGEPPIVRSDHALQSMAEVIGRSLGEQTPSLLPLAARMAVAALHDVTVLITGETGVGKTYLARFLHDYSLRRRAPFLVHTF